MSADDDFADVLACSHRWCVLHDDCLAAMRAMPSACIDAMVTDPPSGIAFMNAEWDKDKGGRDAWIAWLAEIMREALRVCKPGAHALVWSLPRTSHWTATALEDAGWEIRDRVSHLFASGFPKSHNVSKAIDRLNGDERKFVGMRPIAYPDTPSGGAVGKTRSVSQRASAAAGGIWHESTGVPAPGRAVTAAGSSSSAAWEGWGTALKPAVEDWWLVRKPLGGSIADNVLEHGTGGLNIDACRIGAGGEGSGPREGEASSGRRYAKHGATSFAALPSPRIPDRRWPSHLALSHSPGCVFVGEATERREKKIKMHSAASRGIYGNGLNAAPTVIGEFDTTSDAFDCAPDCPVRMLDEQSGETRNGGQNATSDRTSNGYAGGPLGSNGPPTHFAGDAGGASRFFFVAKPSQAERAFGLEEEEAERVNDGRDTPIDNPYQRGETKRRNKHPTVKSLQLMRWLVRLVTPPGGLVIDPFCGSGSTLVAAIREGVRIVGIEEKLVFADFARARVARWAQVRPELDEGAATQRAKAVARETGATLPLFAPPETPTPTDLAWDEI